MHPGWVTDFEFPSVVSHYSLIFVIILEVLQHIPVIFAQLLCFLFVHHLLIAPNLLNVVINIRVQPVTDCFFSSQSPFCVRVSEVGHQQKYIFIKRQFQCRQFMSQTALSHSLILAQPTLKLLWLGCV